MILLCPTNGDAFTKVGFLDECSKLFQPGNVFPVTGQVIHHHHNPERSISAVVIEGDAVTNACVSRRPAIE